MAETLIAAERIVPAAEDPAAGPGRPGPGVAAPGGTFRGYVLVRDSRVAAVAAGDPPRPPDVHLASGVLVPGFVDLQVNGYFGVELADTDPDGWRMVSSRLPETGTTAFQPTFITAPVPRLAGALRAAARLVPELAAAPAGLAPGDGPAPDRPAPDRPAPARTVAGARVLGVHLEGPFISPVRAGAHTREWITEPSPRAVSELLSAGAGILTTVTLAPELPGALEAVRALTAAGVLVSVGHSDATAAEVDAAAGAGARMVTHLFNGQRPLHHREPGVTGQALADPRLACGLIADFSHVVAPVCRVASAAAPGRIFLVTDAAACAGMPPGRYLLGGRPIELPAGDGVPPVRPDGTLAGSALRMDRAVANMVSAGTGLADAVAAATRIPADLAGRPELGRIAPGALADLTWLDDDLRTRATWVAGQLAYDRTAERKVVSP